MEGVRSIFAESWKLSMETNELEKYLMTFQNFLCRVPKWNSNIIEDEKKRIVEKSGCGYLEDRRPGANLDPYLVCEALCKTICL
jgi:hypothetical protein